MIRSHSIHFRCSAPADVQPYFVFPYWTHHLRVDGIALRQVRQPWFDAPCEHGVSIIGRAGVYDVHVRALRITELEEDHSCPANDAMLRVAGMLSVCRRGRLKTLAFDERTSSYRVKRRALRCDVVELAEHLLRAIAPVLSINEIELTYATNQKLYKPQLEGHLRYLTASRAAIPPPDHYQIA